MDESLPNSVRTRAFVRALILFAMVLSSSSCTSQFATRSGAGSAATEAPTGGSTPNCSSSVGDRTVGPPTTTVLVSGSGQRARVNEQVPARLVMQARDADGDSVPGINVSFTVTAGGGRLASASAVTDAAGCASVEGWTLGGSVGTQRVTAEIPGLAPVFFEAEALADDRGGLRVNDGNHQYARTGADVTVAPSVLAVDANNRPAAGRTIRFTITSGGGTVSPATVVTDANGVARVTRWTLGNQAGPQVLSAQMGTVPPVTVQATATLAGTPNLVREAVITGLNHP